MSVEGQLHASSGSALGHFMSITAMAALMPVPVPQIRSIKKRLEEAMYSGSRKVTLTDMKLRYTPPFAGVAEHILHLDLSKNEIAQIPEEFGRLTALETLNLSENKLTGIPFECLKSLVSLRTLVLHHNQLTSVDPRALPSTVELLDVSFNKLSDIKVMSKLPRLQRLVASNNAIRDLPPLPGILVVQELNLAHNLLRAIPASLGALKHLQTLSLRGNQISETAVPRGEYGALRSLNLSENHLVAVPSGLEQCTALQFLYLYRNRLEGALPDVVGSLVNLQGLNVSYNLLTSVDVVARLSKLEFLVVSFNRLSGVFPAPIMQLRALVQLHAHNNSLSAIALTPQNDDLELLDVSHNLLSAVPQIPARAITKLVVRGNPCVPDDEPPPATLATVASVSGASMLAALENIKI